MTSIEVNEATDGEVYTFIIKEKSKNSVVDLTNYTGVTMTIVSNDLKTSHGSITLGFGTKASGEIEYTTDTADPYPAIPAGVKYVDLVGQLKITGSGIVSITEDIEIRQYKDYSSI